MNRVNRGEWVFEGRNRERVTFKLQNDSVPAKLQKSQQRFCYVHLSSATTHTFLWHHFKWEMQKNKTKKKQNGTICWSDMISGNKSNKKIEQKIIELFKLFWFFFLSSSYMSSISCACHIMKLVRDSFHLKSKSVYGRCESWPSCFSNGRGKKRKREKNQTKKTEEI